MQKEVGKLNIGVLALQGAFTEHINVLNKLKVQNAEVRSSKDLKFINGLIIPGGESTAMNLLLGDIKDLIKNLPVFGTCAGAIIMTQLGLIDMEVERNAYGSQLNSFEDELNFNGQVINGVFIRAPKIKQTGKKVRILATNSLNEPVLVSQNKCLGSTFHPELTSNTKIHEYFLQLVKNSTQNL